MKRPVITDDITCMVMVAVVLAGIGLIVFLIL
jgi:nitrogen fixation-related uncharacterized protein